MLRPIHIIIAIGFALALLLPPAVKGQGGIGPGLVLNDIDADSDGKISRDEYIAARDREFTRYDQNGDGNLSMADFARSASYRRALGRIDERVAQADKGKNGVLSREETHNAPTVIFGRADTSKDGIPQPERDRGRAEGFHGADVI